MPRASTRSLIYLASQAQLYDTYKRQGLVVLGAPSNEFGGQEPGTNAEIKDFAAGVGAKFPMLAKLQVNGSNGEDSDWGLGEWS